jgi:hypothetical protein
MAGKPGSPPVRKSEDYLLERKTQNDLRDRLKTRWRLRTRFVLAMWQQSSSANVIERCACFCCQTSL